MIKRIGNRTLEFTNQPTVRAYASVAGKKESEGPLGGLFDKIITDSYDGLDTYEDAESQLQTEAMALALKKGKLKKSDIDFVFAGDLLNQCVGSSFGLKDYNIPYLGQYGACSTMAQNIIAASVFVESGAAENAGCSTSSHFCSAERQYRYPLEYGAIRTPTAQWTVTGAGCCIIGNGEGKVKISRATVGKIIDLGITDANNMGAAMAPAICIIEPYPMLKNAGCIYVFTIILQKRRFLLQIAAETIKWIFRVNLTSTGGVECQRKFQPKTRDITYRRTTMNCPN